MVSRNSIGKTPMPKKHEGRRVLLVEDTRFYSIAIRDRLENLYGVRVIHCATFSALKRELKDNEQGYSLAILDLCQSDAPDGEALDYVISNKIGAVVFSGISSDAKRDRILAKSGVEAYIAKSSVHSIDELAAAVDKSLSAVEVELLILDPEPETPSLSAVMSKLPYSSVIVRSEAEAFDVLDTTRGVELMIVRAEQAQRDGYQLFETLRSRYGEDALRIVGFSNAAVPGQIAGFLERGGADFFDLSISAEDLAARLKHVQMLHKQIQMLQRMASRDYLTDLLNRRYFFDRGPKIVDLYLRQGKPVSMALLDIDHFKRLNDTYGHEIGDDVLKAVARKLTHLVGEKQHLVARLGGEEFGVLFAGLDIAAAFEFCEYIRTEVSKICVVADEEDLSVTISMGLANITGSETFDNYLNAADQYLYMAKHSGRNRVFSDYQITRLAS